MSLTDLGEAVVARLGLRPPRDLDEAGVPEALLQDLTLRRALFEGRTSTLRLAEGLCVSPQLVTKLIEDMRELRLFEIQGLDGRDYQLALTDHGRQQAQDRMQLSRYAGAAPVPLSEYSRVVLAQRIYVDITRDAMRTAFSDLVINDALLDEVGPALIAEGAMFLYGPPGTGKTSIAERMIRIYTDPVVVPRAVEVDSQIIQVFDPSSPSRPRSTVAGCSATARPSSPAASSRPTRSTCATSRPRASTWRRCRCRPTTASSSSTTSAASS